MFGRKNKADKAVTATATVRPMSWEESAYLVTIDYGKREAMRTIDNTWHTIGR